MIFARASIALILLGQIAACSSAPKVARPPDPVRTAKAVRLDLVSDPQLNLYQKKSHSLILCLYQLRDPGGFNQLLAETQGLPRLLECSRFDPSVTASRRLVIQPGQRLTEELDLPEETRFFGVVAGYYSLEREGSARLVAVPVAQAGLGSSGPGKEAPPDLALHLGARRIEAPRQPDEALAPHPGETP